MITNAQKKILHIAQHKLELTRDEYESVLFENAGVHTSLELTNQGFDRVMKRFEELGFKNTAKKRWKTSHPKWSVTADQQQLIRALYAQLGWDAMPRQMGFNKRCCGKSWPQTRTDANKVIEGLKAIAKRELEEAQ